jgi:hypothetical protein
MINSEWVAIDLANKRTIFTRKNGAIEKYLAGEADEILFLTPVLDLAPTASMKGIQMKSTAEVGFEEGIVVAKSQIVSIAGVDMSDKFGKLISAKKAAGFKKPKIALPSE